MFHSKRAKLTCKLLIIERYPFICEIYELVLQKLVIKNPNLTLEIQTCCSLEVAYQLISDSSDAKSFDLIILETNIPGFIKKKFISGEDIALYIRKEIPRAKIIINTAIENRYCLRNIFRSIKPEGFCLKAEFDLASSEEVILAIFDDKKFFSKTIIDILVNECLATDLIDSIDRQILYQLSQGVKTSSLINYIPLSISGIEKRKRKLADFFNLATANSSQLINCARECGYI